MKASLKIMARHRLTGVSVDLQLGRHEVECWDASGPISMENAIMVNDPFQTRCGSAYDDTDEPPCRAASHGDRNSTCTCER